MEVISEKALELSKKYTTLDIKNVQENNWNPNHLEDKLYLRLKASLDNEEWNAKQPIIVREIEPSKFEIIDGAHRYKAMKELWFEEIVAVVEELSDADARIKTISMNKLRWEFDPVQLAILVKDLKENYGVDNIQLEEILGYTEGDIINIESLVNFNFDMVDETFIMTDELQTIMLELTPAQKAVLDNAAKKAWLDPSGTVGVAIERALLFIKDGGSAEEITGRVTDLEELPPEEQMVSTVDLF